MATTTSHSHVVMDLLKEVEEKIEQQDAEALKKTVTNLEHVAQASVIMQILAPFLFQSSNTTQGTFSSHEALTILGCLVQWNPSSYLKPASQAICDEARRLVTSVDPMVVSSELMMAMINQITGADVQAASNATDAVVACCHKLGASFAEQALGAIVDHWKSALSRMSSDKANASTVAIRCASALLDLVTIDEQLMKLSIQRDWMQLILDMLKYEEDPLLQMSVLDILEKTAHARPMYHELADWLFSNDVLMPLLQLAGGTTEEEPDPILGGNALRVVAALCKLTQVDARVFAAEGSLLTGFHRALHNFEGSGEIDRLAMIDAVSSFAGASSDALALVLNDPITRDGWLSLNVSQSKLKAAILVSVARVLSPPPDVQQEPRHSNADLIKLYVLVGSTNNQETTTMLLEFGRSPLPEIRLGAYTLLEAVARLPTGGQILLSTANFIDFLLSREGERTKEGREAHFAIVQAINDSPVKALLADEITKKIEQHISQGPHYVKSIPWELATES
jgi:hypothetical protein